MDKRPQFSAKHKTDLIPKNASCVKGGTHSHFSQRKMRHSGILVIAAGRTDSRRNLHRSTRAQPLLLAPSIAAHND